MVYMGFSLEWKSIPSSEKWLFYWLGVILSAVFAGLGIISRICEVYGRRFSWKQKYQDGKQMWNDSYLMRKSEMRFGSVK